MITATAIAPVYVVRGNNDKEWAKKLPAGRKVDVIARRLKVKFEF